MWIMRSETCLRKDVLAILFPSVHAWILAVCCERCQTAGRQKHLMLAVLMIGRYHMSPSLSLMQGDNVMRSFSEDLQPIEIPFSLLRS